MPTVVGIVGVALAVLAIIMYGWRAGVVSAGLGAVLLTAGFIGDVVTHNQAESERQHILQGMTVGHDQAGTVRLQQMEHEEAQNIWHLPTGLGAGMLTVGLGGTAFLLWRRYQDGNSDSGSWGSSASTRDAA